MIFRLYEIRLFFRLEQSGHYSILFLIMIFEKSVKGNRNICIVRSESTPVPGECPGVEKGDW